MRAVPVHTRTSRMTRPTTILTKPPNAARGLIARFLALEDLPQLLALEGDKWDAHQAASAEEFAYRIECFPQLAVGAFCARSGRLVASLFMKPAAPDFWMHARDWSDCAQGATPLHTGTLFGISLSSREPDGVRAVVDHFWPHALAAGWREAYLGSPIPGWREWHRRHPGHSVVEYVRQTCGGAPLDPQLRYYHRRGFREIMCIKRNYFPHERSQDHGVILRGTVPLSSLAPVWRVLQAARTRRITRPLQSLLA
jgi:hypothetical protein